MKTRTAPVILAAILITCGCSGEKGGDLVPADYLGWASTVDGPLLYQIPGHTMDIRKIYINETGKQLEIIENDEQVIHEYPEGTIILKESYHADESERPVQLTVMIKSRKDSRARGGWIWLAKDVATGEETIISDEFCFTCHQNANEPHPYGDGNMDGEFRDFVFYPWNPENGE